MWVNKKVENFDFVEYKFKTNLTKSGTGFLMLNVKNLMMSMYCKKKGSLTYFQSVKPRVNRRVDTNTDVL